MKDSTVLVASLRGHQFRYLTLLRPYRSMWSAEQAVREIGDFGFDAHRRPISMEPELEAIMVKDEPFEYSTASEHISTGSQIVADVPAATWYE